MKKTKKLIRSAALALTKVRYGEPPIVVEPVPLPSEPTTLMEEITITKEEASFEHLCSTLISMYSMEEWAWADSTETLIPLAREGRDYYLEYEDYIIEAYTKLHSNTKLIERLKAGNVYNRIPQVLEFRALALAKGMTVKPDKDENPQQFTDRRMRPFYKRLALASTLSTEMRYALITKKEELDKDVDTGRIDEQQAQQILEKYEEDLHNAAEHQLQSKRPQGNDNWRV